MNFKKNIEKKVQNQPSNVRALNLEELKYVSGGTHQFGKGCTTWENTVNGFKQVCIPQ